MFRDVKIGKSCALGMGCVVTRGSQIGDSAVLQSGTSVYGEKLEGGRKYTGSPARLIE
jgi:acetyltransferase-like isoleucine patch superfamily enzyme